MTAFETLILVLYFFILSILAVYGWHRYYLVYLYMKHKDQVPQPPARDLDPLDLAQFVEADAAARAVDAVDDHADRALQAGVVADRADAADAGTSSAKASQAESAMPEPTVQDDQAEVSAEVRKAHVRQALFQTLEPVRIGRFILLEVIGSGSMGEIYAAYDEQLDRKVALKLIHADHSEGLASEEWRARLLREARAIAAMQHDHIVTIYRVDEDRGIPFLAMPYLAGESLEARVRRQGEKAPLPIPCFRCAG